MTRLELEGARLLQSALRTSRVLGTLDALAGFLQPHTIDVFCAAVAEMVIFGEQDDVDEENAT